MTCYVQTAPLRYWAFVLPLIVSLVLWLPAINIPFWQDDYFYIFNAKAEAMAGEPFWTSLWPGHPPNSWNWRPLSQEFYWRLVVSALDSNSKLAHLFNVALLYVASMSLGVFSYIYSKSAKWAEPCGIAILSAGLYSIANFNFMTVYWVSAANGSLLSALFFFALTMFLIFVQLESPWKKVVAGVLLLSVSIVALLVKESAVLIPALCFIVWISLGKPWKSIRSCIALLFLFVAAVIVWWKLRTGFVLPTPPEYGLQFSINVIRNFAAQVAWMLNVPRESIRLLTLGQVGLGLLWVAVTAVPVVIAMYYVRASSSCVFGARKIYLAICFAIVAYSPYYFLGWNSYEYYVSISIALLFVLFSRSIVATRHPLLPISLVIISSAFAIFGNLLADYPAFIARAKWAERTLSGLEMASVKTPLVVNATDEHRFSAIRLEGLALRLKIPADQIMFAADCGTHARQMLVIDETGGVSLEDCQTHSKINIH